MKITKKCAGYSLIELLTALTVIAGLMAVTMPSMLDYVSRIRLRSAAEMLLQGFNLARASAVQRNSRVTLCKSSNGITCTDAEGWHSGWLIFQDENASGRIEQGEKVIYRQIGFSGQIIIAGNVNVEEYVSYTPFGQAKLLGGAFQAGTFTVCPKEVGRIEGYQVLVAATGRARMAKATSKQCK